MSVYNDDDMWWYEQEAAEEAFIEETLKGISTGNAQEYLGSYGDAIQDRVDRCIKDARDLVASGSNGSATVMAASAIEIVIRFMLVRPLVQGAFLSDEWSAILANRIASSRSAEDRELLPAILRQWKIDITAITLDDGSHLWPSIVRLVWPKRNKIVHQGDTATQNEAQLSIDCAATLMSKVVTVLAGQLGFSLDTTGKWAIIRRKHCGPKGEYQGMTSQTFDPKSPFDGS